MSVAADALAIASAKALYCKASDMPEAEAETARSILEHVLHPDFSADYTKVQFATKSQFIDFITKEVAPASQWVWHSIGSPLIHVTGNTAHAEWAVSVRIRRKDAATPVDIAGRYSDDFVRIDGRWKIVRIEWVPLD